MKRQICLTETAGGLKAMETPSGPPVREKVHSRSRGGAAARRGGCTHKKMSGWVVICTGTDVITLVPPVTPPQISLCKGQPHERLPRRTAGPPLHALILHHKDFS